MTDKEIYQLFVDQMEEELARDEMMMNHLKNIHRVLRVHQGRLEMALSFSRLPPSAEGDAEGERLACEFSQSPLENETRRLIAQHESLQERRGAFLARMRTLLESL